MTQTLRPVATTNSTNIASGDFSSIDEVSANDADYVRSSLLSDGGGDGIIECRMSEPANTPAPGTGTLHYRHWEETATGELSVQWSIRQGATIIDSGQVFPGSSPTTYTATPNLAAITDWSDVRFRARWRVVGGTGSTNVRGRLSWVELIVPDGVAPSATGMMLMF